MRLHEGALSATVRLREAMKTVGKFQGMGRAMIVGCDMVAAVGVGVAIGWWLDNLTGWSPWCLLVFFVLGAAAGFRMVYHKIMSAGSAEQQQ
jgi:F0F1-type ATP synthase assembly protein I